MTQSHHAAAAVAVQYRKFQGRPLKNRVKASHNGTRPAVPFSYRYIHLMVAHKGASKRKSDAKSGKAGKTFQCTDHPVPLPFECRSQLDTHRRNVHQGLTVVTLESGQTVTIFRDADPTSDTFGSMVCPWPGCSKSDTNSTNVRRHYIKCHGSGLDFSIPTHSLAQDRAHRSIASPSFDTSLEHDISLDMADTSLDTDVTLVESDSGGSSCNVVIEGPAQPSPTLCVGALSIHECAAQQLLQHDLLYLGALGAACCTPFDARQSDTPP
jgi:hypothetical protein